MKTDLFFPKKAYMMMLSIFFALTLVSDTFAQCYFDDCPSPPVVTVIADYDAATNSCEVDFEHCFEFAGCTTGVPVGTVVDAITVVHPITSAVYNFNVEATATGAEACITGFVPPLPLGSYQILAQLPNATTDPRNVCEFVLVVQETHSLACNDDVNIALDANCQANILVDMILEGEVSCFDEYTVAIDGYPEGIGEVVVDAPGTYGVTITSPSGQSCWSTIEVEDKFSQPLFCNDISAPCSQDHTPGQQILNYNDSPTLTDCDGLAITDPASDFCADPVVVDDMGTPTTADDVTTIDTLCVELDFGLSFTDTLMELDLFLDLETTDVSHMEVFVVSPSPTSAADTLKVLDLVGNTCHENDLLLELADDHFLPHAAFDLPLYCNNGVSGEAHQGQFKPLNPFSTFTGKPIQGAWKVLIVNHSTDPNEKITVNDINMTATYGSGIIGFPIAGSNVSWVPTGDNTYSVNIANNNCGPYTAFYVDSEFDMCNGFTRTWTLENGVGLTTSCSQSIIFDPIPTLIFPGNYDGYEYPSFNCSDILDASGAFLPNVVDANGNISPEVSGYPHSEFGDIDLCGRFQIDYSDVRLDICGNSYKILRTWTVVDWCLNSASDPNAIREHLQVIKVEDVEGPIMVCPADPYEQNSDPYTCTATWLVVRPITVNDCGVEMIDYAFKIGYLLADDNGEAPVNATYDDANVVYGADGNPLSITGLPVGRTWLRYSVEDECGNVGECFAEIDIIDGSDPFAVCLEHTVATLGPTGCVVVNAPSFDNGSWDNCGDVTFKARIATGTTDLLNYEDQIEFCCDDCGKTYEIDLLVTDLAGNTSSCTVDIDIIDNLPPVQVSLPQRDVTRACIDGPITADEWRNQYIGDFEFADNCQSSFTYTLDPSSPAVAEPDECGTNVFVFKWNVSNDCGEDFTYDQSLTFINALYPSVQSWPSDLLNLTECANNPTPEELNGYPAINNDACAQVAVTYEDQIFTNVDNACIKILRSWTVIDWCRYNPNDATPTGISSHVQTIKIVDSELPVVTCPGSFSIDGTTDNCVVTTNHDNLILEATDDCTTEIAGLELNIWWEISSGGSVVYSGNGNNANGTYPYGNYSIQWFVEDHCENLHDACVYPFSIVDTKKPTPYCLGTVVTATMENPNAGVEIWASDFDLGGTDNYTGNAACNNTAELDVFFLDGGVKVNSLSFDCDDVPNGSSSTIFLDVWYEDQAGNRDFCTVTLVLQDNENDACDGPGSRMIQGRVRTEDHIMVKDVTVEIDSNEPEYPATMITSNDGEYQFENLSQGTDYTVSSTRNDAVLNGVSTLDIVLIQKHILGIQQLNSEYKIIAADANNSGSVSAIDLIEIRKVILGINQVYPNNQQSWRFVDATQTWPVFTNPFPFDEIMDYTNFNSSMFGQDIVAVKIGDVNNNATVNLNQESTVDARSGALSLEIENELLTAGTQVEVPVYASNFENMMGYQFTFETSSSIEIVDVKAAALEMDRSNFGWENTDRGVLTTSWNAATATTVDSDDVLFTLVIEVEKDIALIDALEINSEITAAEAYDFDLNTQNVTLQSRNGDLNPDSRFELYQNVPNPFDHSTEISFNLPVDSDISLTVYNVDGKVIKVITDSYTAGKHTIRILGEELNNHTGLMYYQLETDGFMETKKMIHVK